ncbi:MAG: hypothetical protein ACI8TX_002914 [Hyphomicrobiaceae bacterium]|jgi:hypothetical protein
MTRSKIQGKAVTRSRAQGAAAAGSQWRIVHTRSRHRWVLNQNDPATSGGRLLIKTTSHAASDDTLVVG